MALIEIDEHQYVVMRDDDLEGGRVKRWEVRTHDVLVGSFIQLDDQDRYFVYAGEGVQLGSALGSPDCVALIHEYLFPDFQ